MSSEDCCLQQCLEREAPEQPWEVAELCADSFSSLDECLQACYTEEDSAVYWWQFVLAALLVLLSGLFSGLTLGLLGLDKTLLEVILESGEEREREYAKKIAPVREHSNLLLCTLLLGNTVVNSLLSILLSSITSGFIGLLLSTALIVVFGTVEEGERPCTYVASSCSLCRCCACSEYP